MRRATLLAAILTLAFAGIAQAGGPSSRVTGSFTLTRGWFDDPDVLYVHTIVLSAHTNPTRGTFSFTSSDGEWYTGPVTCLVVDGADAWVGGPGTAGSGPDMDMFFRIHDGGRASLDRVVGVVENAGVGIEDCQTRLDTYPMFSMTSGNVTVSQR